METLVLERVKKNLSRLKLSRLERELEAKLASPEADTRSHLQFLDELLEEEVGHKDQRRVETAIKIAGLPYVRTLDDYDFSFHPDLDRRAVQALYDLDFIRRKENVLFLDPPGVGKTHLAVAMAIKAAQAGMSIYFTTMFDLIGKLKRDRDSGRTGKARSHNKCSLVVVDEVGYTPIDREECHLFFQFVSARYEKSSTVITSNKSFNEWTELFADPVIVTAILDRLLHHCQVVNIKGHSYRLNGKTGLRAAAKAE